jgi:hypothetical protein
MIGGIVSIKPKVVTAKVAAKASYQASYDPALLTGKELIGDAVLVAC